MDIRVVAVFAGSCLLTLRLHRCYSCNSSVRQDIRVVVAVSALKNIRVVAVFAGCVQVVLAPPPREERGENKDAEVKDLSETRIPRTAAKV